MKPRKKRFPGLRLSPADRQALIDETKGRKRLSGRRWRRIRMLFLLDAGWNLASAAAAAGTFPREARRVGTRFLERGLEAALSDDPRPKPSKMLDATQGAAIVAMVCSKPPKGLARWTLRLIAKEAVRRGLVPKVGHETIRQLLLGHELKPWREKNVVHPEGQHGVRRADGRRPQAVGEAAEQAGASRRAG